MSGRLRCLVLVLALSPGGGLGAGAAQAFDSGMQALGTGNYAEAYCQWKPLAERGHVEAQYHLGWLYANGNGLAVDIERAVVWWQRAAGQGHADAQFALGLAYTTGEGLRADLGQAVGWYLAAARQGHQDARDILLRLNGDATVGLLEIAPEIAREPWFGWPAWVKGDRINLRAGPGIEREIVDVLARHTAVRVIGEHSDWYRVTLAPDRAVTQGWIHRRLVSTTETGHNGAPRQ